MAQVSLPRQPPSQSASRHDSGHTLTSPLAEVRPEPNPPFVFPARPSTTTSISDSVIENVRSIDIRNTKARADTSSRNGSRRSPVGAIPIFDFRPSLHSSASLEVQSQPASPTWTVAATSRAGGHRRGGSEFIGGDSKAGGPGLMSTSPTKGEGALPPPVPAAPLGKPTARKGHAHRRSGAISCHDLSFLNKVADGNAVARGGSAPTTPAETDISRATFFSGGSASPDPKSPEQASLGRSSEVPMPRARVGFSDTLEFIPRPLSTLSSESSSTLTTIRGAHSVSGSISSLASASTASPPSTKGQRKLSRSPSPHREALPRPNTANAIMSGGVTVAGGSMRANPVLKRSKSASGSPNLSSEPTSIGSASSKRTCLREMATQSTGVSTALEIDADLSAAKPLQPAMVTAAVEKACVKNHSSDRKPDRHNGKKNKKVRLWAGSILSRKARHKNQKAKSNIRRVPTPPLLMHLNQHPIPSTLDFDEDRTCTIVSPSTAYAPPLLHSGASEPAARTVPAPQAPVSSPMIDLDAALGPFNTPDLTPEIGSPSRGGFSAAKRRMHSSGITGGFLGPGMHYHRRTESAPEMAAFELGPFGLHRLGSCSTMADVFEEDEECQEEVTPGKTCSTNSDEIEEEKEESDKGTGIQVVDSDDIVDGLGMIWSVEAGRAPGQAETPGGGVQDGQKEGASSEEQTSASPSDVQSAPEVVRSPVEIADDDEPPRASSLTKSSDSTVTPPLVGPMFRDGGATAQLDLGGPASTHPYLAPDTPSLTNSSFPSPDFPPSSFDVPRSLTAASSFTDDHLPNSLMRGEPGPELRVSVDDVPSLTSSSSTMTSAVRDYSGPYSTMSEIWSRGDRSSSISSTFSGRPSSRRIVGPKRASLVSLSRLVGSSHGEKSKLSIEEKAQPDGPEKGSREKRGKRLSRLMHFWKPKESNSAT